jgi:hypothetical protein
MLHTVPVPWDVTSSFIEWWHRTHEPPPGGKFWMGCADETGLLRGVAVTGRPVARSYDDGYTLEVTRVATDGARNANSLLYSRCWQATRALGYTRLITYTQEGESGASLRALGWKIIAERPPHKGWNRPSRPREDKGSAGIQRYLWEAS